MHHYSSLKDVPAQQFIWAYAKHLKKSGKLEVPEWVDLVKTGVTKKLAPLNKNWVYIRAAALARKVYLYPGVGVGALRHCYGGMDTRKMAPGHKAVGAGKINRYLLQQLEKLGYVEKVEGTTGRSITKDGRKDMDLVGFQVYKRNEKKVPMIMMALN